MYRILFYHDKHDVSPVLDYIKALEKEKSKDSRIKLNKILDYIEILSTSGTRVGVPYVKHLGGEFWEIRPLKDRIIFVAKEGDSFVLLHHFRKKTQKTPKRELEKARRELEDLKERGYKF